MKHLKLLNAEEDLLTVCSSPSPTPSRNGSTDGRSCIQLKPDGFNESSELNFLLSLFKSLFCASGLKDVLISSFLLMFLH